MAVIAVQYTYSGDTALADQHRGDHRAFVRSLYDAGSILLSGPLGGAPGALLVMSAASEEEALALLDQDPFLAAGVITGREARLWTVVTGELPGA